MSTRSRGRAISEMMLIWRQYRNACRDFGMKVGVAPRGVQLWFNVLSEHWIEERKREWRREWGACKAVLEKMADEDEWGDWFGFRGRALNICGNHPFPVPVPVWFPTKEAALDGRV